MALICLQWSWNYISKIITFEKNKIFVLLFVLVFPPTLWSKDRDIVMRRELSIFLIINLLKDYYIKRLLIWSGYCKLAMMLAPLSPLILTTILGNVYCNYPLPLPPAFFFLLLLMRITYAEFKWVSKKQPLLLLNIAGKPALPIQVRALIYYNSSLFLL